MLPSHFLHKVRFKYRCNILISGKIIKELPGLVGSVTPDTKRRAICLQHQTATVRKRDCRFV